MGVKQTEALNLALEALEESLGYVEEEAENAQRLYGKYPTRQARIQGLKDDARKHMNAITAIREALAEESSGTEKPAQQDIPDLIAGALGVSRGTAYDLMREALAEQPAQQQEPLDKNGSPCAEFWDWLPKAYNFEGAGNFTKYNMEVAFLAGKQSASAQEPVEYWTVADGWVSEQAEVPAFVWVEPDFWEHCKRVNCGTAYRLPAPGRQPLYTSPPASKPLTDEEIKRMAAKWFLSMYWPICNTFAREIEAKLREKNA